MMIEKTASSQSLHQQNHLSQSALTTGGGDKKKATFIGVNSNILQTDTSATKKGFIIKPQHSD